MTINYLPSVEAAKLQDLITNLQDDYEDNLEVEEFEEDIAGLKEKTDHLIGTLEGKIATEKEELKEKPILSKKVMIL